MLYAGERYDGALYVCGYAVELALKAKICKTLRWHHFPSSPGTNNKFRSVITHNLGDLLHFSGIEEEIMTRRLAEWSSVQQWDSEARYRPINSVNAEDVKNMIDSTKQLLEVLLWEISA